jgi:hypothetical protein
MHRGHHAEVTRGPPSVVRILYPVVETRMLQQWEDVSGIMPVAEGHAERLLPSCR